MRKLGEGGRGQRGVDRQDTEPAFDYDVKQVTRKCRFWSIAAFTAVQYFWSILEQERALKGWGAGSLGRD